jgi:chemotaxis regulatin CheY-phosphate phosphatase CheZ
MAAAGLDISKHLELLVNATEAILRGEFDKWDSEIDAEGMLSVLAQRINALVVNMKNVESPLASAGAHAPSAVKSARNVIELMAEATGQVLDSADKLASEVASLESQVENATLHPDDFKNTLANVKSGLFDIIASQSYQDVARQKMESLIADLGQIRDWLVEVLVILNIQKNGSPENLQKRTQLLRDVSESSTPDQMKQGLVDDLLAEFGF